MPSRAFPRIAAFAAFAAVSAATAASVASARADVTDVAVAARPKRPKRPRDLGVRLFDLLVATRRGCGRHAVCVARVVSAVGSRVSRGRAGTTPRDEVKGEDDVFSWKPRAPPGLGERREVRKRNARAFH